MKQSKFRTPLFIIKIFNFEYWPFWIFYIPLVPYMLWLAVKARSLSFFTNVNPSIPLSGIIGESKINILRNIDQKYVPETIFIDREISEKQFFLITKDLQFPVICKPDVGERGSNVEKVNDAEELSIYYYSSDYDFLIQDFIPFNTEFGVMYYKYPDGSGSAVTSVVQKSFLEVVGDGSSTIHELLESSARARFVMKDLQEMHGDKLNEILKRDEKFYPQPIGNHCKGTMFINANDLINDQLKMVFDTIALSMKEFYFGRFDIRVKSIEEMYLGENIFIMEVNGVTSEPGHIYDPRMKLLNAYKDVFMHAKLLYRIGKMNKKRGFNYSGWKKMRETIKEFRK